MNLYSSFEGARSFDFQDTIWEQESLNLVVVQGQVVSLVKNRLTPELQVVEWKLLFQKHRNVMNECTIKGYASCVQQRNGKATPSVEWNVY